MTSRPNLAGLVHRPKSDLFKSSDAQAKARQQLLHSQLEPNQIRVLHLLPGERRDVIICRLKTVSFQDNPNFETLSYVWGDSTVTEPIIVDGIEVQVTTNLAAALRHLQQPTKSLILWVDAVCINQDNETEKSFQVAMMGDIYRKCSQVHIWLGYSLPPSDDEKDPFDLVRHYTNDKHLWEVPGFFGSEEEGVIFFEDNAEFQNIWSGFSKIAESTWWNRFWTVQEAILPALATVHHGYWKMSFSEFLSSYDNYNRHGRGCCRQNGVSFRGFSLIIDFFQNMVSLKQVREDYLRGRNYPLENLLSRYLPRACKDPRDKIFGLLALIDKGGYGALVPNYTLRWEDVFIHATQVMLRRPGTPFKPLCSSGHGPKQNELPSWVRNLAAPVDYRTLDADRYRRSCIIQVHNASSRTEAYVAFPKPTQLEVIGVFLGTVSSLGSSVTFRNLDSALRVIQEWRLMILSVPESSKSESMSRPAFEEPFWRTMLGGAVGGVPGLDLYNYRAYEAKDMSNNEAFFSWLKGSGEVILNKIGVDIRQSILTAITRRSFFLTSDGRPGLCYPNVLPGDEIWVVHGAKVPFIFRPCDGDKRGDSGAQYFYHLGDCYADGLMDGTAFNNARHKERKVILV